MTNTPDCAATGPDPAGTGPDPAGTGPDPAAPAPPSRRRPRRVVRAFRPWLPVPGAPGSPETPPPAPVSVTASVPATRRAWSGVAGTIEHCVVAGLAFLPLLLVQRGVVTSDTKTYLYLDPTRFLSQVAFMWNPTVALGTVTHEYIGYLLPMGPFYAVMADLHVPIWVAQRLWLGGILFAAGAGILYLCRVLRLEGPGRVVAALAYMLSPYFLQYAGRISVILLPWAGLPWMLALAVLALRRGGWRHPALFALVVALVSGINATAILYVGIGPALWLVYAVAVEREGTWRRALGTALKIGALTLVCCLWWIAGLQVEAAYGVDVLKYTETVPSTSQTASPAEIIRGLGYWYFYGSDRTGPWTAAAVLYTQQLWLLATSYAVPVLAFLGAVFTRWRHRAFFALLVVVGLVLSVGAHPFDHPTPLGGLLKRFMTDTTAGMALRSTDRATPLVLIGLAMLLGAGVSALWWRLPRLGLVTGLLVAGLVVANNPAVFNGDAEVASFFTQPAHLPTYQMAAIRHLNATHPGTRVLAIPGNDFAAYRWGDTVDTPQPAYLTRPFVTREQQVMGSMATADTLYAMDDPVQQGTENWNGFAPMARLLSGGDVLVEYDQAYEHYGVPQSQLLAEQLASTPSGLTDPVSFGSPRPNVPAYSMLDEQNLATPANPTPPAPLVDYTVTDPRPITRAESDSGAVLVAGDATGLQEMANLGLLDTRSAIYYAGTLDTHPALRRRLLARSSQLVVTDTNRKQAFRWDTLTANYGATETSSQHLARNNPSDSPIDLFPGAPLDARTVAAYSGAVDVSASSYGNSVSYTPENRPYSAVDGNLDTAWETGVFIPNPGGQWWQVSLPAPVTENHITLVQTLQGDLFRHITKVTLTFDGRHPQTVTLGPASRTPSGQVVDFSPTRFRTLRITIDRVTHENVGAPAASEVGLAEVEIPGVHVTEVVKMPTDLLSAAGPRSLAHRLTLVMTRQRVSPFPPRTSPETTISRQFTLPTARTFTLSGTASLSALIPDDEIDRLLGRPGAGGSGIIAYSKGRLPGSLASGAAAALDGNPATAWQPGFGAPAQAGEWLEYNLAAPVTFDHLNLQIVADGRHSVPTSLTVSTETAGQQPTGSRHIALPPIADSRTPGAVTTVPVSFPALTGQRIRITVTGARLEYTTNFDSPTPIALPLGIAELGIPGLQVPPLPPRVPGGCQSNLIHIDGNPVSVRVVGSTATALVNGQLSLVPCGPDANGIHLAAGTHVLQTALATTPSPITCPATDSCNGWNVDQLVLDSAPGGGPEPATAPGAPAATTGTPLLPATQPGPVPKVAVTSQHVDTEHLQIRGATGPFELVLGQSIDAGWHAVADPGPGALPGARPVALGLHTLVDAFANGWQVTSADLRTLGAEGPGAAGDFSVVLNWTPQRLVWVALGLSAAGVGACLILGVLPAGALRFRRRARRSPSGPRHARRRRDQREEASATLTTAATAATAAQAMGGPPAPGAAVPMLVPKPVPPEPVLPEVATLSLPTTGTGHRPRWWVALAVALVTGGAAAAITAPLIGLAVGVAVVAALLVPQARAITALLAVGLLVAAAVDVISGQAHHPVPMSSNWPDVRPDAALMVWMAAAFLGADAVVEAARSVARRRRRGRPRP